jgi:hypothetical protein
VPLVPGLAAVFALALRVPVFALTADCSTCAAPGAPPVRAVVAPPPAAGAAAARLGGVAASVDAPGLGRTFDGGGSGVDATGAAVAGGPAATPAARFSAAFNAKLVEVLSASESGRRVLDRLRGPDGALRLPPVALVDLGGGSIPAQFDRWSTPQTMELDRRDLAAAVRGAPAGSSAALAAYLTAHPAALDAAVRGFDVTLVHELTHAWQARRDLPVDIGADANREPIEWEVEAYREQMLYFHEKLGRDPSAANSFGDMQSYTALLTGYDAFRGYVTALYQGLASGSFPRIEQALARRKNSASSAADVAATRADYAKREADFIRDQLPAIQSEGFARLLDWYRSTGRPDKALALLAAAPDALRAEYGPAALAGTLDYLKKDPPAPIDDRPDAWQAYIFYLQKTTGGSTVPNDMFALYRRDYRAAAEAKAAAAAAAKTPAGRRAALHDAVAYASYLPSPEKEQLLKRIAAQAGR